MFRAVDAGLLRASVHSATFLPEPPPDLHSDNEASAQGQQAWIAAAWAHPAFAAAVEVASPDLAARIEQVRSGAISDRRQVRRAAAALLRYGLRAATRPTPFGLFAGVAPVHLGTALSLSDGKPPIVVARPDAMWLRRVAEILEEDHDLLSRLPVVVNQLAVLKGARLVVEAVVGDITAKSPIDVSLRATRPVESVLRLARDPIVFGDLAAKIAAEFPTASEQTISSALRSLVAKRVLLTELRAPMTATDPLSALTEALHRAEPSEDWGSMKLLAALDSVHRRLRAITKVREARDVQTALAASATALREIKETGTPPLAVDVRLDEHLELPTLVVREAQRAAELLLRLTGYPTGSPAWAAYHGEFLERFGIGAVVPIRELVDPACGMGFPAGYRGSLFAVPKPPASLRDRALTALALDAALTGSQLELDEATMAAIGAAAIGDLVPPPHVEIGFHLRAASIPAANSGDFQLVVDGASRSTGTTTGRFTHLLTERERSGVASVWSGLPTLALDAHQVQLSGTPLRVRTENVGRVPAMAEQILSLGEYPTSGATAVSPDELAVTADLHGMRLISLTDGSTLEPLLPNAIEPASRLHPLQRFLFELPRARATVFAPFDWGPAAADLPVLPQLRSGRAVISPARWHISADRLPSKRQPWAAWQGAWESLRERYRIPRFVALGASDVSARIGRERTHRPRSSDPPGAAAH